MTCQGGSQRELIGHVQNRTEQNNNALLLQVLGDTTRHCTLISDPPRYRPFARNRRGKPNVTRAPLSHTKGSAACPVSPVDTGRFEGPEASSRGGARQPPHGDEPGAPPHSRVGGIPNLQSRPSRLHPLSTCGSIQAARGSQEPVVPLSCRPLSRLQLITPVASVHGWRPVC